MAARSWRSNCLAALKVLEMICDLLPACACSRKRGEGMGARNVLCRSTLRAGEGAQGENDHCKCRFSVAVGSDPSAAEEGRDGAEDRITGG